MSAKLLIECKTNINCIYFNVNLFSNPSLYFCYHFFLLKRLPWPSHGPPAIPAAYGLGTTGVKLLTGWQSTVPTNKTVGLNHMLSFQKTNANLH